jgi:hypothetical protein
MTRGGETPMNDINFWKIELNKCVYVVNGTIRRSSNSLEFLIESEAVKSFLRHCMETQEVISNPLVNVGQSFHFYAGEFKVIRVDEKSIVLSKSKI